MGNMYDEAYIVDTLRELFEELIQVDIDAMIEAECWKTEKEKKARKSQLSEDYCIPSLYYNLNIIEDCIPIIFTSYDESKTNIPLKNALREHINLVRKFQEVVMLKLQNKKIHNEYLPPKYKKRSIEKNIETFKSKIEDINLLMGSSYHFVSKEAKNLREELLKALANPYDYVAPTTIDKKIDTTPLKRNLEKYHLNKKEIHNYIKKLSFVLKMN